jgi:hypothetical protein
MNITVLWYVTPNNLVQDIYIYQNTRIWLCIHEDSNLIISTVLGKWDVIKLSQSKLSTQGPKTRFLMTLMSIRVPNTTEFTLLNKPITGCLTCYLQQTQNGPYNSHFFMFKSNYYVHVIYLIRSLI